MEKEISNWPHSIETKPFWWDRYHKPFPIEEQNFYEEHKNDIETMIREMDWQSGKRSITYIGKGFNKITFTDNF